MSLLGENYHYFMFGEDGQENIRLEIKKDLSDEEWKFLKKQLLSYLDRLEERRQDNQVSVHDGEV